MLETCVDMYYCETHAPGWLSGGHPSVADGTVQHKVCFTYYSGCCHNSSNVTVLNCGEFYVYQLRPTPFFKSRYCGNGISSGPGKIKER